MIAMAVYYHHRLLRWCQYWNALFWVAKIFHGSENIHRHRAWIITFAGGLLLEANFMEWRQLRDHHGLSPAWNAVPFSGAIYGECGGRLCYYAGARYSFHYGPAIIWQILTEGIRFS